MISTNRTHEFGCEMNTQDCSLATDFVWAPKRACRSEHYCTDDIHSTGIGFLFT